jgi:hypothetical protein
MHQDKGVQSAFAYLVALVTSNLPAEEGSTNIHIDLKNNPSPIRITRNLINWVQEHTESTEYAELACRAAAETIADWTFSQSRQQHLFDDSGSAINIWTKSIDGSSFCKIARKFFASLTDHYIRYFIDREASSQASSLQARERLEQALSENLDDISNHAFETSKITQSFSAGWFNKYARNRRPNDEEISRYLAMSFSKLQEELKRESMHK